ncbi:GIY-YIG nuclease family protein [Streptomyces roseolus]
MARETRAGEESAGRVVYVIGAEGLDAVKIGTTGDLGRRLSSLQTGLPVLLSVLWTCEGGRELERALHEEFRGHRRRGEWFDLTGLGDPVAAVCEAARRHAPALGLPLPPPYEGPTGDRVVFPLLDGCVEIHRTVSSRCANTRELELLGHPPWLSLPVVVLTAVQIGADGKPLSVTETAMTGGSLPEEFLPPMLPRD